MANLFKARFSSRKFGHLFLNWNWKYSVNFLCLNVEKDKIHLEIRGETALGFRNEKRSNFTHCAAIYVLLPEM